MPDGPVTLQLSFVVGPRRNWLNLWKQTIDSLDPLLGRTVEGRAWHPRDGRITDLGLHVEVDPSAANEVTVGIAAAEAPQEVQHTRHVLRTAARAHGWTVSIDDDEYPADTYHLPGTNKWVEVTWAASGGTLTAVGRDGDQFTFMGRSDDAGDKARRVLRALSSRTGLLDGSQQAPPIPTERHETDDGIAPPQDEATDSLRAEIEQILINHSRTRYAQVLQGMRRGLSDAQMSMEAGKAGEPINAESIAEVRRLVRLSLADELVTAPSDAAAQAGFYRELLNHRRSPTLTQHIKTKLATLRTLDPMILLTPLGHAYLGANRQAIRAEPETACTRCFMVHAGECP